MSDLIKVDDFQFVERENEYYISGVEICRRLGYSIPKDQARIIWKRHSNILNKSSVEVKLPATDGKLYRTRCYNELGTMLFISKCNIDGADQITESIFKAFLKLRDLYLQGKGSQWELFRIRGKNARRDLTNIIKDYMELAVRQGCKNPQFYFMNFTKVMQKGLFGFTSLNKLNKNMRDYLNEDQLNYLTAVETFLKNELILMIEDDEEYHVIYRTAVNKINKLVELFGCSKPALLTDNEIKLLEHKRSINNVRCDK